MALKLIGRTDSRKRSMTLFHISMARRQDSDQPLVLRAICKKSDGPLLMRQSPKTWLTATAISLIAHPAMAQFTAEQEVAFGLNAGRLAGDLNDLIAGVIFAVILLGFAFMAYAAYGRWTTGQMSASSMSLLVVRASLLLVIAGLFLR